jgi:hypothetical protein
MELFTDPLEQRPVGSTRPRHRQSDLGEPLRRAQVSDLNARDLVAPQVSWQRSLRWNRAFSQVPVPLGPYTVDLFAQIKRIYDIPTLPTIIGRRNGAGSWIKTGRDMPQPPSGDGDQLDVESHRSGGAW